MPNRAATAVAGLQAVFEAGAVGDLSDGQLLDRFVARRDEAAVATLVGRHGPMVRGVCRRILQDPHDADDAFQATFLVLARRAASVTPSDRVGPWLHGVAVRTARKARATRARRRSREVSAASVPELATQPVEPDDRLGRLDGELSRLPAKYRLPIVLCDLQGRTHREAADHLGWPVGTVAGRLVRGRALLTSRLARPGPAASGPATAAPLVAASSDLIPPTLLDITARGMARLAMGRAGLAGLIPAQTLGLAEGVATTMMLIRLKWIAVALAAAGMLGAGSGWLRRPHHAAQAAAAPAPPDGEPELQGIWTGVVAEVGGNPARPSLDQPALRTQLHVKGDQLTLRGPIHNSIFGLGPALESKFTYLVDGSKTPATIDLMDPPAPDDASPTVRLGIYRREGDNLLLCLSIPNKKRPAKLATERSTTQMLLKLRKDDSFRWEEALSPTDAVKRGHVEPTRNPVEVEPALEKLVVGKVVEATEVSKDQMILAYLPYWAFGRVDNIGVGNNDGGVRTLLDWPAEAVADALTPGRSFVLALYSRTTTADDRETPILAAEIESDWSEGTSWRTQPRSAAEPAATFPYRPGEGWKLFDVTDLVRRRAKEGRVGRGIVLRFRDEDRIGSEHHWSDYRLVSREGAGEWRSKRPVLLVVEPPPK